MFHSKGKFVKTSEKRSDKAFYGILFLLIPLGCFSKSRFVSECPGTECLWSLQAYNEFLCNMEVGLKYHCITDLEGRLIETCMIPEFVPPGKEGCPFVYVDTNNQSFLRARHSECPTINSECPQLSHPGYYTNELYKYPVCLRNESERSTYSTDDLTTGVTATNAHEVTSHFTVSPKKEQCGLTTECVLVPLVVATIIAIAIGALFVYRLRTDNRRHKVTEEETRELKTQEKGREHETEEDTRELETPEETRELDTLEETRELCQQTT